MIKEFMFQYPTIALILFSLIITLTTKIIAKFTTDQNKLKSIREETKKLQKKMKTALKNKNNKAYEKYQKKSLQLSQEQMKISMKSLMFTFIPIILLFSLLRTNIAYESLNVGDDLDIDIKLKEINSVYINTSYNFIVSNALISEENKNIIIPENKEFTIHLNNITKNDFLTLTIKNSTEEIKIKTNKYITNDLQADYKFKDSEFSSAQLHLKEKIYVDFWFLHLNWFWTYFILAMIFSTALTKILKIY